MGMAKRETSGVGGLWEGHRCRYQAERKRQHLWGPAAHISITPLHGCELTTRRARRWCLVRKTTSCVCRVMKIRWTQKPHGLTHGPVADPERDSLAAVKANSA